MGLSPEAFGRMTVSEFVLAWSGWMKREQDRIIHEWEMTRWQTWVLTSIQLDRKDRVSLQRMFPMPWDAGAGTESKEEPMTISERRQRVQDILRCVDLKSSEP